MKPTLDLRQCLLAAVLPVAVIVAVALASGADPRAVLRGAVGALGIALVAAPLPQLLAARGISALLGGTLAAMCVRLLASALYLVVVGPAATTVLVLVAALVGAIFLEAVLLARRLGAVEWVACSQRESSRA